MVCKGAGHGGLTSAARLQQLKIPTLIVDRNSRIDENWRNRYVLIITRPLLYISDVPNMTRYDRTCQLK